MNKSFLRKKLISKRKKLLFKGISFNFKKILNIIKQKKIKNIVIGGYYPYYNEVDCIDLLTFLEKKGFIISLPKIRAHYQMDFYNWSIKDPLYVNRYGIPEPVYNKKIYPNVLIIPMVGYDEDLNRLGYGGGFYDRYLQKFSKDRKILKIGLAYTFQKIKKIPINKYDIKLDFIFTEKD